MSIELTDTPNRVIQSGTVLTLTTGRYSDYRDHGPFRVMKVIDKKTVADEFRAQWKGKHAGDQPDQWEFMGWLSRSGYVADIDGARSWHLGDYDFEPE